VDDPQAYAASFFLIPAIRTFFNSRRNRAILERNQARLDALNSQRKLPVRSKIDAAEKLAKSVVIEDKDIIYTSDRSVCATTGNINQIGDNCKHWLHLLLLISFP
jgi:hypothetical protein